MPDEMEIAGVARQITVIEARLIAARHLKLADRIRLLENEKRKLERRLVQFETGDDPLARPRVRSLTSGVP
jgi:hypothetical protein